MAIYEKEIKDLEPTITVDYLKKGDRWNEGYEQGFEDALKLAAEVGKKADEDMIEEEYQNG
jgi:hypothetical protein